MTVVTEVEPVLEEPAAVVVPVVAELEAVPTK